MTLMMIVILTMTSTAFADEGLVQKVIQKREQERLEKIKKMGESKKKMDEFVKANETPDQKRYRELKESVVIVDGDDPNNADTIEKP